MPYKLISYSQKHLTRYESAPVGFFTLDETGIILETNHTGAQQIGLAQNAPVPNFFANYLDNTSQAVFRAHLRQLLISQIPQRCELIIQRKDSSSFEAQLNSTVYFEQNKAYCYAVLTDISAKKYLAKQGSHQDLTTPEGDHRHQTLSITQAEQLQLTRHALVAATERYEKLVNSIEGIVWEANADPLQFTFVSRQAERLLGFPIQAWLESVSCWVDHIHPDDRAWVTAACTEATAKKQNHDLEYRMLTADNRVVWIKDLVVVEATATQPTKLYGVMFDITHHKQAEEDIALFKQFIINCGEGMGMATLTGEIVYVNDTLLHLIGEPSLAAIKGKVFTQYYPKAMQARFQEEIIPCVLKTGKWSGETCLISTTGEMINTFENFFLLRNALGTPCYLAAVISNINERKRFEHALEKSEERLRLALEAAGEGVWNWNLVTNEVYYSDSWCQSLGYQRAEVPAEIQFWEDLIHPDDKAQVKAALADYFQGRAPYYLCENRLRQKSGQYRWNRVRGLVIEQDSAGKPLRMVSTHSDITQSKQTEIALQETNQALQESETRFWAFFENAPDAIFVAEPETGMIIDANAAAARLLLKPREAIIGFHQSELHPPARLAIVKQKFIEHSQLALTGEIVPLEEFILRSDGCEVPVEILATTMRIEGRMMIQGVFRDITERKRSEEQLRRSEERFRNMFEEGSVGMVIVDSHSKFIKANQAFCQMLGYTEAELLQLKVSDVSHSEDMQKNKALIQQVLEDHLTSYHMEKRYIRRDGKLVWGNIAVSIFYNDAGERFFLGKVEDITERKRAEKALKNSEAMLARAQEIAHLGNWEWVPFGNSTYSLWSDENYRILGYEPHAIEPSFENFMARVHPDDRAHIHKKVKGFFEGETQEATDEFRIIQPTGVERIIRAQAKCYFDEGNQLAKIIGTLLDITERKHIEEELQKTTEHLASIVDMLPIVPYTCKADSDFRAIYMSKNVKMVTGYPPERFIQEPAFWFDRIHPDDREGMLHRLSRLFQEGFMEREYRFRAVSGRYKWVQDILRVVKTADGTVKYIAGIWLDIDARKRAETHLRESELRIRTIVENMVDGVVTINEHGLIESFNPAAERIFGYAAEMVLGRNVSMLMPEPYCSEHDSYIQRYLSTGKCHIIGKGREVEGLHNSGNRFPLDLAVSRIHVDERCLFIGIVRDITQRKQAEKALQQAKEEAENANRAKSEFLANMSHEIRTPMNAVLGFSDLLAQLITDSKQKNYLKSIQAAGKSLLTLISDVLDLSKIEAGRLEIQYEVVNPHAIFNEIRQIFAAKVTEKGLESITQIDESLPSALFLDEIRLRQVLLNLVGNAIKFTETGYVELSARKIDKGTEAQKIDLCIAIRDSGVGIPETQQARIFESFLQQDGQSTRKYGGTGLGLAITKRLIEMMNGDIIVTSQVGMGSTFEVILHDVTVSTEAAKVIDKPPDLDEVAFEKVQVLVADDVASNRLLIREYLSQMSLVVIEAEDGQQALELAEQHHPEIILMDIKMPKMDGYEAVQRLKQNPAIQTIPTIALTAVATSDEWSKIKSHHFDGFLLKPVNIHNLLAELCRHLKHQRFKKENPEAAVTFDLEQTAQEILQCPQLVQVLAEEIEPLWRDMDGLMEINAIEVFATKLTELGAAHTLSSLVQYGDELQQFVQDFDIANIEKSLKLFAALCAELQKPSA